MKTDNQISEPSIETPSERGDGLGGSTVRQSPVDHAQIIRTWEDSLEGMKTKIKDEQKKAEVARIIVGALQEAYWRLEGRLDVAKELVRKQSILPNTQISRREAAPQPEGGVK